MCNLPTLAWTQECNCEIGCAKRCQSQPMTDESLCRTARPANQQPRQRAVTENANRNAIAARRPRDNWQVSSGSVSCPARPHALPVHATVAQCAAARDRVNHRRSAVATSPRASATACHPLPQSRLPLLSPPLLPGAAPRRGRCRPHAVTAPPPSTRDDSQSTLMINVAHQSWTGPTGEPALSSCHSQTPK